MLHATRLFWRHFGVAIGLSATALLLNLALDRVAILHAGPYPYFIFAAAVAGSAFIGGFWTGLAAVAFSALMMSCIYEPVGLPWISKWEDTVQLGLFLVAGSIISLGMEVIRRRLWRRTCRFLMNAGVALSLATTALLLNLALDRVAHLHQGHYPYFFFAAAVVSSAYLGGFWTGLAAVAFSALMMTLAYEPVWEFRIAQPEDIVELAFFILQGTILSLCMGVIRSVRQELLRRAWQRYGIVLLVLIVALLLKLQLYALVANIDLPFLFFYVAVILGARYGGLGPVCWRPCWGAPRRLLLCERALYPAHHRPHRHPAPADLHCRERADLLHRQRTLLRAGARRGPHAATPGAAGGAPGERTTLSPADRRRARLRDFPARPRRPRAHLEYRG